MPLYISRWPLSSFHEGPTWRGSFYSEILRKRTAIEAFLFQLLKQKACIFGWLSSVAFHTVQKKNLKVTPVHWRIHGRTASEWLILIMSRKHFMFFCTTLLVQRAHDFAAEPNYKIKNRYPQLSFATNTARDFL